MGRLADPTTKLENDTICLDIEEPGEGYVDDGASGALSAPITRSRSSSGGCEW